MKKIEIKDGNKTKIKFVPDDWVSEENKKETNGDLTTGNRKSISYSDIPSERWEIIFGKK